ncbi:MAG TPA: hypothetical protein VIU11_07415, partial [Nakamurella sp.]
MTTARQCGRASGRASGRVSARVAVALVGALAMTVIVPLTSQALVVNGVENGDLSAGTGDAFECFTNAGWGDNDDELTAVPGRGGAGRAASLTLNDWASGDRKLLPSQTAGCAPAVTAGSQYLLGVWYTATRPVNLTLFRHSAAGWTYYTDLQTLPAASAFTQVQLTTPVLPEGTDQLSWGLSIAGDGTVVTDD